MGNKKTGITVFLSFLMLVVVGISLNLVVTPTAHAQCNDPAPAVSREPFWIRTARL